MSSPQKLNRNTDQLALNNLIWTRTVKQNNTDKPIAIRQWSRYERLSFSMLGYTWGILMVAVTALHFGNYHLETKTSSTSGSHSSFYESAHTIMTDDQRPQPASNRGTKP